MSSSSIHEDQLIEKWAQASSWTFRAGAEQAPTVIGKQDDRMRVEVAFFPATGEMMIELFDRQRVRGGILSVVYGDRLDALFDVLGLVRNPHPNMFPSLVKGLIATFDEVYDASDFELIPIDAEYLRLMSETE